MKKSEKYRKILKIVQYAGYIAVFAVMAYFMFKSSNSDSSSSLTFPLIAIFCLFLFLMFVLTPMQQKLLNLVILDSISDLVENIEFSNKKGYKKETFESFNLTKNKANDYSCSNYYSFTYRGLNIESATVNYSNTYKTKVKGKNKKVSVKEFLGKIYLIPYNKENYKTLYVYGKKQSSETKVKSMVEFENLPIKVKKYAESFEAFSIDKKVDVQPFLEKLYSLKLQAKGNVSAIIKNNYLVLCIDNNRIYEEVDIKKPINEDLYRNYRKDLTMVLTFINMLLKED